MNDLAEWLKVAAAWLKARLGERNSRRAIGVLLAIGGYFGVIDPSAMEQAGAVVGAGAAVWLAVDAFLTPEAPKAAPEAPQA